MPHPQSARSLFGLSLSLCNVYSLTISWSREEVRCCHFARDWLAPSVTWQRPALRPPADHHRQRLERLLCWAVSMFWALVAQQVVTVGGQESAGFDRFTLLEWRLRHYCYSASIQANMEMSPQAKGKVRLDLSRSLAMEVKLLPGCPSAPAAVCGLMACIGLMEVALGSSESCSHRRIKDLRRVCCGGRAQSCPHHIREHSQLFRPTAALFAVGLSVLRATWWMCLPECWIVRSTRLADVVV